MRVRARATLAGSVAVLMWATLALLTASSGKVPPFQLTAMAFALASLMVLAKWLVRGEPILSYLRQPPAAWALGVAGLFGYHFFYFLALRNAPAVEASLIAYLWPLLIVLFAAALPGQRLGWRHVAGALLGLAGAGLITAGDGFAFKAEYALGYGAAALCALIWSSYSVLSRHFERVPSDAVGGYCAATAVLSLAAHLGFETTVWPADLWQWLAVAGLGLGPVGSAFFFWDHGVKRGDIQLLGVLAYAAPLLSTLLLIAFALAPLTWQVVVACLVISGGAALAARASAAQA